MTETHFMKRTPWTLGFLTALTLPACQQTFPIKPTAAAAPTVRCLAPELPMQSLPDQPKFFPSAACVSSAKALVAGMSPRAKYGQMMQPDRGTVRLDDPTIHGLGSILSGGGSGPPSNEPLEWAKMVNRFRAASLKSEAKVPMIYGIDAVHGHNNVRGAVIFPHNIGLGATRDADLVERVGRVTAKEVAATNIDWTFAPVLAAARDERWGRTYEAFGETAELAELLGTALIRGLQGSHLGQGEASVLACAKHFIGDGNTQGGKDQGNSPVSLAEVRRSLLPAYQNAIAAGVGSIMVSFSSVEGVKMHCHGPLINDVLKGELGFSGFVVSDWEAVEQLPGNYEEQLVSAINSGIDMVMAPKAYAGFIDTMEKVVPARIPQTRVDDAVARIIATKCELGMLNPETYRPDRSGQLPTKPELLGSIGSAAHREVAREAVRKSLVLLKNDRGVLPLKHTIKKLVLAGSAATDIGRQSGGWTITWQGQSGDITEGTTLEAAVSQALPNTELVSSADGSIDAASAAARSADVAIVVLSEPPYAEYSGDNQELTFPSDDIRAYRQAKALGIPVVVVLYSGRPMILGDILGADAVVAAWLPGSEGSGITDVLLGEYDFIGRLGHSWPRTTQQIPINVGDKNYDPLFPYGYGLSYPGFASEVHPVPAVQANPAPPADPRAVPDPQIESGGAPP